MFLFNALIFNDLSSTFCLAAKGGAPPEWLSRAGKKSSPSPARLRHAGGQMGIDIYSTSLFCGMGDSDGLMLLHCLRIIRRLKWSFPGAVVYSPKNCWWKLKCLWSINKGAGRMLKSIMNRPRKMTLRSNLLLIQILITHVSIIHYTTYKSFNTTNFNLNIN